jgi:hypothetical protein
MLQLTFKVAARSSTSISTVEIREDLEEETAEIEV